MKKTPFYSMHEAAGAKFGSFAGYEMPLFYPLGVMKEHLHTRQQAGLFDISHMVHIEITGIQAADLIARACPYDPHDQAVGSGKYTFFLNENAGIIDDLIVSRLEKDRFLIVANAGCAVKDVAHISKLAEEFQCEIAIIPRAFLALQGPSAETVLERIGLKVADMAFMTVQKPKPGWFLSRSGYTGEDGFEIGMPVDVAIAFVEQLLGDDQVEWIGLGARDSLRLEAGLSLYGQDLSEDISPHEAGLIWAIPKPLRESGTYIGSTALVDKIAEGRKRKRIGFRPQGKAPVRSGSKLVNEAGEEIGFITSGGFGPTLGGPIALGLISSNVGEEPVFAEVRGKQLAMDIVKTPFVPHQYKR